jgi:hypothetical protein
MRRVYQLSIAITVSFLTTACGALQQGLGPTGADVSRPILFHLKTERLSSVAEDFSGVQRSQALASLRQADELASDSTSASERIDGTIVLRKENIFDRVFLYGFDLQYSSAGNAEYSLLEQSMALGHVPAVFRRIGDDLQLIAENSRLFESTVNHPETLINEYKIVHESDAELTITMNKPGMLVHKTLNGKDAAAPLSQWLRSLEHIDDGQYLLQETAIMLATGEVKLVLESLFPRESLVPEGYTAIEDNRDTNKLASRFMLIANEDVYVERSTSHGVPKREKTKFANRFHLGDDKATIDWYVTSNAPEELMPEIQSGVIGWNRYFAPIFGRDVVQFKGRLPSGIKLGDPRFNVINFDTVAEAGAAYESQASDPVTGIQSHSLVYMPYAWYNIAAGLSKSREMPSLKTAREIFEPKNAEALFGTERHVLRCARLAGDGGTTSDQAVDEFGRRVFISTLFHEVGHALGLGHNFKASLAFDGSKPYEAATNPTTHSVMDYNYYQHEQELFAVRGEAAGPILEYDRQAISYLYKGPDSIVASDKSIPACHDEDADLKTNGVDPTCIRYDAEMIPIVGLEHAYARLSEGALPSETRIGIDSRTLAQAFSEHEEIIAGVILDAAVTPDVKALELLIDRKVTGLDKLAGYYITQGAQSLRVNLTLNSVALRAWRSDPAVDGVVLTEGEWRKRYLKVLSGAIEQSSLPVLPSLSLKKLIDHVTTVIKTTERFGSEVERSELALKIEKTMTSKVGDAVASHFARLRASVAPSLAFDAELSFASGMHDFASIESMAVTYLSRLATRGLSAESLGAEGEDAARKAAVEALKTYQMLGVDYTGEITTVKQHLGSIKLTAKASGNQAVVDHVRSLEKILN